jgi:elongation factor P
MAALIDAINVKRKTFFEFENTPLCCLEANVNTPTARGGQTLVRLKMRNLLTNAVFEKTFKASDKFKEPDLQSVEASYHYSDRWFSFSGPGKLRDRHPERSDGRGRIGLPDRRRID